jgi:clan AA aspartic protease (TIGR02281 family)
MRRFGFAALAAWVALAASAFADCAPQATIALQPMASGHFVLPMDVNGTPMRFLIDTGASNSLLTTRAADATGLPRNAMAAGKALGGAAVKDYVTAPAVGLGGIPQGPIPFAILSAALPVDGIIGLDILSRYDVTFDFPSARMMLYAPGACTPAGQAIAYTTERGHIVLTALVDGKPITAWLDSGA